jgi:hypothetical protein
VGRSELRSVESLLLQALIHALQVVAWPDHSARRKWRNEIPVFLMLARRRYQSGRAQHLDLAGIHADAAKAVRPLCMRTPPGRLPDASPLTVAMLLEEAADPDALTAHLAAARE